MFSLTSWLFYSFLTLSSILSFSIFHPPHILAFPCILALLKISFHHIFVLFKIFKTKTCILLDILRQ